MPLQNVSVSTPSVPLFSLCILNGGEPSVKLYCLFDGLAITYSMEENQRNAGRSMVTDEPTFVVDTIDDFIPNALIASRVFCPQCKVIHQRGNNAYPNIGEDNRMT